MTDKPPLSDLAAVALAREAEMKQPKPRPYFMASCERFFEYTLRNATPAPTPLVFKSTDGKTDE